MPKKVTGYCRNNTRKKNRLDVRLDTILYSWSKLKKATGCCRTYINSKRDDIVALIYTQKIDMIV